MPSYQGSLDGLCGPYAVANALEQCGLADDHEALFRLACSAPALTRWPNVLWLGTSFADLQRMIKACLDSEANTVGLEARYPFWRDPPESNAAYWARFDSIFEDEKVVCGIIGITRPMMHWIVVSRDGRRLLFTDCSPSQPYQRKNRSSLFAGQRARKPNQWLIDRRELVVFRG
jgi:hypothetical protein